MEGEQRHYELRSRSRSRSHTPMVLNQTLVDGELAEHHYDLRSKSRERSHTPGEVSSSRRSGTRSLPGSSGKQRDRSLDTIVEPRPESRGDAASNDQNRRSESVHSNASRKAERRSERQRAKRQMFTNGQTEAKEDSTDEKPEKKRSSLTPKRMITSDYSSEEGEKEDPPSRPGSAYEIYKQAGDWWNVFPKTDYTYSQKSQFRYEIAPGVLAMPNMSRPSIHSDGNSTTGSVNSLSQQNLSQCSRGTLESDSLDGEARETIEQNRLNEVNACRLLARVSREDSGGRMIYRKTHYEQYSSQREIIHGDAWRNRFGGLSQVDSDTELDEAVSLKRTNRESKWRVREWLGAIRQTVILWLSSGLEFVNVKILRRRNVSTSHAYHRYQESRWKKMLTSIERVTQYLYLMLVRILFLDTWLLSRATSARQQLKGPRSKLIWLILLPPLLLGGFWFLSCARDAVLRLSPIALSPIGYPMTTTENDAFQEAAYSMPLGNQETTGGFTRISDEDVKKLMEHLVSRVEKLELAESSKVDRLANITQSVDELRKDKNVWQHYNDKLKNIEKNAGAENAHTVNEMNSIKLEFRTLRNLYTQLKTCCDTTARLSSGDEMMDKQIERVVAGYFGSGAVKQELNRIVESQIIANEDKQKSKIESADSPSNGDGENVCASGTSLSDEDMRRIVNEILKIYDADKTGRVDYALESAGGQVISTRCTQRYNVNTRAFKVLGITLYYESNNPRTVIQGNPLQPGACWAFQDFPGYLLIKLRSFIKVTGFTVEHAPKTILPNREMKSAPRKFNVWGLKDDSDSEPVMFGEYEFADSEESLQYFPVQNTDITVAHEYVELRIHSNHGQLEYTCLYRFRVHGIPV